MSSARDVVTAGWRAWLDHDLEACMEVYAEDAELIVPGMEPFRGKAAVREAWKLFMAALPDETATLRHIAEGNTVVTEWTSTATNSGPLPLPTGELLPATGKTVTLSGVDVAEVVDGKLRRHAFYWDNASFLQQLGLMPAPEAAAAG